MNWNASKVVFGFGRTRSQPGLDLAKTEDSRERGADGLALDRCANLIDARFRLLLIGRRSVVFRSRHHTFVQQPLHPAEIHAREVALR